MPDTKLSALTALTGAAVQQTLDSMPIVDQSVTQTKQILVSEVANALLINGTPTATTSGTSITLSGIPSWAKKISFILIGVSTNGTDPLTLALLTTGGGSGSATSAAGTRSQETLFGGTATSVIITAVNIAARTYSGLVQFTLEKIASSQWSFRGIITQDSGSAGIHFSAGKQQIGASPPIGGIQLSTTNGVNTFDAGEVNVLYE